MNRLNVILILMIFALFVGCAGTKPSATNSSVLKVGISANYPPLAYKEDGKIVGIEPDYAVELGKILDKRVKIVEIEWEKSVEALNSGQVDVIMSGASITDKRKSYVLFSDPYMQIGQMAVIRDSDIGKLSRPVDVFVKELNVGVVKNTTGAAYAKRFLELATIYNFENQKEAIMALKKGAIDYFIHDAPTVWRLASDPKEGLGLVGLYRPLTEEYLAWAVKKDNVELKVMLDAALAEMKKNGKLNYIQNTWIKTRINVK